MKRIRLRIESKVFNDDTGELLAQELIASTADAVAMVRRCVEKHGRIRMRVETALGGQVIVDHYYPNELGPARDEVEP